MSRYLFVTKRQKKIQISKKKCVLFEILWYEWTDSALFLKAYLEEPFDCWKIKSPKLT